MNGERASSKTLPSARASAGTNRSDAHGAKQATMNRIRDDQ
jgi:hypothetical protein